MISETYFQFAVKNGLFAHTILLFPGFTPE